MYKSTNRLGSLAAILLLAAPVLAADPVNRPWGLGTHPLAGTMTEAQWMTHVAEVSAALQERAATAGDGLEGFEALLTAANWTLAYEIEPMASRLVLGIARPDDAAAALRLVALAREQLERAAEIWEAIADSEQVDRGARWRLGAQLETLQSFADGFAAIWSAGEDEDATAELRRGAASDLALVLESDDREVAAAGLLWQSFMYTLNGNCVRAMELLPPVLNPTDDLISFDLFARLVRCQCTAGELDGPVAAVALLARLEERSTSWTSANLQSNSARRTVAFFRRRVLANWAARLEAGGDSEMAEWCVEQIEKIDANQFSNGEAGELLRLGLAAPEVVRLEGVEAVLSPPPAEAAAIQPASATQPAATSAPASQPTDSE